MEERYNETWFDAWAGLRDGAVAGTDAVQRVSCFKPLLRSAPEAFAVLSPECVEYCASAFAASGKCARDISSGSCACDAETAAVYRSLSLAALRFAAAVLEREDADLAASALAVLEAACGIPQPRSPPQTPALHGRAAAAVERLLSPAEEAPNAHAVWDSGLEGGALRSALLQLLATCTAASPHSPGGPAGAASTVEGTPAAAAAAAAAAALRSCAATGAVRSALAAASLAALQASPLAPIQEAVADAATAALVATSRALQAAAAVSADVGPGLETAAALLQALAAWRLLERSLDPCIALTDAILGMAAAASTCGGEGGALVACCSAAAALQRGCAADAAILALNGAAAALDAALLLLVRASGPAPAVVPDSPMADLGEEASLFGNLFGLDDDQPGPDALGEPGAATTALGGEVASALLLQLLPQLLPALTTTHIERLLEAAVSSPAGSPCSSAVQTVLGSPSLPRPLQLSVASAALFRGAGGAAASAATARCVLRDAADPPAEASLVEMLLHQLMDPTAGAVLICRDGAALLLLAWHALPSPRRVAAAEALCKAVVVAVAAEARAAPATGSESRLLVALLRCGHGLQLLAHCCSVCAPTPSWLLQRAAVMAASGSAAVPDNQVGPAAARLASGAGEWAPPSTSSAASVAPFAFRLPANAVGVVVDHAWPGAAEMLSALAAPLAELLDGVFAPPLPTARGAGTAAARRFCRDAALRLAPVLPARALGWSASALGSGTAAIWASHLAAIATRDSAEGEAASAEAAYALEDAADRISAAASAAAASINDSQHGDAAAAAMLGPCCSTIAFLVEAAIPQTSSRRLTAACLADLMSAARAAHAVSLMVWAAATARGCDSSAAAAVLMGAGLPSVVAVTALNEIAPGLGLAFAGVLKGEIPAAEESGVAEAIVDECRHLVSILVTWAGQLILRGAGDSDGTLAAALDLSATDSLLPETVQALAQAAAPLGPRAADAERVRTLCEAERAAQALSSLLRECTDRAPPLPSATAVAAAALVPHSAAVLRRLVAAPATTTGGDATEPEIELVAAIVGLASLPILGHHRPPLAAALTAACASDPLRRAVVAGLRHRGDNPVVWLHALLLGESNPETCDVLPASSTSGSLPAAATSLLLAMLQPAGTADLDLELWSQIWADLPQRAVAAASSSSPAPAAALAVHLPLLLSVAPHEWPAGESVVAASAAVMGSLCDGLALLQAHLGAGNTLRWSQAASALLQTAASLLLASRAPSQLAAAAADAAAPAAPDVEETIELADELEESSSDTESDRDEVQAEAALAPGTRSAVPAAGTAAVAPVAMRGLCSYALSGASFVEQHWYFCYTCDLTTSRGACSECIKLCHNGHDVAYSRRSRFFCDCGAGRGRGPSCRCMPPNSAAPPSSNSAATALEAMIAAGAGDARFASASAALGDSRSVFGGPLAAQSRYSAFEASMDASQRRLSALLSSRTAAMASASPARVSASPPPPPLPPPPPAAQPLPPWLCSAARDAAAEITAAAAGLGSALQAAMHKEAAASAAAADAAVAPVMGELVLQPVAAPLLPGRSYKAGSFECRPKPDSSGGSARRGVPESAAGTGSRALPRSLLSCSGSGLLAVGGLNRVCIFDAAVVAGIPLGEAAAASAASAASTTGGSAGGSGIRPLSRSAARFDVALVAFGSPMGRGGGEHLAVASHSGDLQLWAVSARGDITDRTALLLPEGCGRVSALCWVPHCPTLLAVAAAPSPGQKGSAAPQLLIFDCEAGPRPLATVAVPETGGAPVGLTALPSGPAGSQLAIVAATQHGLLLSVPLPPALLLFSIGVGSTAHSAARAAALLAGTVAPMQLSVQPLAMPVLMDGSHLSGAPSACAYCAARRLLIVGTDAGSVLWSRLCAPDDASGKMLLEPVAWCHRLTARGLAAVTSPLPPPDGCGTARDGLLLAQLAGQKGTTSISAGVGDCALQPLRSAVAAASVVEHMTLGVAAYSPTAARPSRFAQAPVVVFVLDEDGGMEVWQRAAALIPGVEDEGPDSLEAFPPRLRAHTGSEVATGGMPEASAVSFPVDFFESCTNVTPEAKLSGVLARGRSSEVVKEALASEDGFLEAPQAGRTALLVTLPVPRGGTAAGGNIAGVRLFVGAGSPGQIPREVTLGRRVVRLGRGARRWHDLPLTVEESAAAGRELLLGLGPAVDAALPLQLDGLEVYCLPAPPKGAPAAGNRDALASGAWWREAWPLTPSAKAADAVLGHVCALFAAAISAGAPASREQAAGIAAPPPISRSLSVWSPSDRTRAAATAATGGGTPGQLRHMTLCDGSVCFAAAAACTARMQVLRLWMEAPELAGSSCAPGAPPQPLPPSAARALAVALDDLATAAGALAASASDSLVGGKSAPGAASVIECAALECITAWPHAMGAVCGGLRADDIVDRFASALLDAIASLPSDSGLASACATALWAGGGGPAGQAARCSLTAALARRCKVLLAAKGLPHVGATLLVMATAETACNAAHAVAQTPSHEPSPVEIAPLLLLARLARRLPSNLEGAGCSPAVTAAQRLAEAAAVLLPSCASLATGPASCRAAASLLGCVASLSRDTSAATALGSLLPSLFQLLTTRLAAASAAAGVATAGASPSQGFGAFPFPKARATHPDIAIVGAALRLVARLLPHDVAISDSGPPWQRVLVAYASDSQLGPSSRRRARRAVAAACGGKEVRNSVKRAAARSLLDSAVLTQHLGSLAQDVRLLAQPRPAAAAARLAAALAACASLAVARPTSWTAFAAANPASLAAVLSAAHASSKESLLAASTLDALRLFAISAEAPGAEAQVAAALLLRPLRLAAFVRCFLLNAPAAEAREHAAAALRSLCSPGAAGRKVEGERLGVFVAALRTELVAVLPALPQYGVAAQQTLQLMKLLGWSAQEAGEQNESPVGGEALHALAAALVGALGALEVHGNGALYERLRSVVQLDGYYLEECADCPGGSRTDPPYTLLKLEQLRAEQRYCAYAVWGRLQQAQELAAVTVHFADAHPARQVRELVVWFASGCEDVAALKVVPGVWQRAGSVVLAPGATEAHLTLRPAVVATAVKVEFSAFHISLNAAAAEQLLCPRCSRQVVDRHGVCLYCRENAFQCRQCRNINYEAPDAFICIECGHSRHASIETSLLCRPATGTLVRTISPASFAAAGVGAATAAGAGDLPEAEALHNRLQGIAALRAQMAHAAAHGDDDATNAAVGGVAVLSPLVSSAAAPCLTRRVLSLGAAYERAQAAADSLGRASAALAQARRSAAAASPLTVVRGTTAVISDDPLAAPPPPLLPSTVHFGTLTAFCGCALEAALDAAAAGGPKACAEMTSAGLVHKLLRAALVRGPLQQRAQTRRLLAHLAANVPAAGHALLTSLGAKLEFVLQHIWSLDVPQALGAEVALLCELIAAPPLQPAGSTGSPASGEPWDAFARLGSQALFSAVRAGGAECPPVCDAVLHPLLRCLATAAAPGAGRPDAAPRANFGLWVVGADSLAAYSERAATTAAGVATSGARTSSLSAASVRSLRRWRSRARQAAASRRAVGEVTGRTGLLDDAPQADWLLKVLLCPSSAAVRAEAAALATHLAADGGGRRSLSMALKLSASLPAAAAAGAAGAEFFSLLRALLAPPEAKRFAASRGVLRPIAAALLAEARRVAHQELGLCSGVAEASGPGDHLALAQLAQLAAELGEVPDLRCKWLAGPSSPDAASGAPSPSRALGAAVAACLLLRGVRAARSKALAEAEHTLGNLLADIASDSPAGKAAVVAAASGALASSCTPPNGPAAAPTVPPALVLGELLALLCPERVPLCYALQLIKSPSQEEYIRGSLGRAPISSTVVGGTLMRDVKDHVCRSLELHGLLDDDFGCELLVAGRIIALQLPIAAVFERLWLPSLSSPLAAAAAANLAAQKLLAARGRRAHGGSQPDLIGPPMTVTFRLQGLDGEATEPHVATLEAAGGAAAGAQNGEEFPDTVLLEQCGGLSSLVGLLRFQGSASAVAKGSLGSEWTAPPWWPQLLRLLAAAATVQTNRQAMLRLGALPALIDALAADLGSSSSLVPTSGMASGDGAPSDADRLSLLLEKLLDEEGVAASSTAPAGVAAVAVAASTADHVEPSAAATRGLARQAEALSRVEAFTAQLRRLATGGHERAASTVARILPRCAAGSSEANAAIAAFFAPCLAHLIAMDADAEAGAGAEGARECDAQLARTGLASLRVLLGVVRDDAAGCALRRALQPCAEAAAAYVVGVVPPPHSAAFEDRRSAAWALAMARPGLLPALQLLEGLLRGNGPGAEAVAATSPAMLAALHVVEASPSSAGIAAENVLQVAADASPVLGAAIAALRAASRDNARRLALQQRERTLQQLGMQRAAPAAGSPPPSPGSWGGSERIVAAGSSGSASPGMSLRGFGSPGGGSVLLPDSDSDEEESETASCIVCREGYVNAPTELLGVYVYAKRVQLSAVQQDGEWGYSTVSHFNLIHCSCHTAARRADAALKTPKREWDGAAVRNNETLCNALLPVTGPLVSQAALTAATAAFWDSLGALGRADGPRWRLLAHDFAALLRRFGRPEGGAIFAEDCRGGGRESNVRYAPALVALAASTLRCAGAASIAEARQAVAAWSAAAECAGGASPEYILTLSLLVSSDDEWAAQHGALLRRSCVATRAASAAAGFAALKPALTMVGMVDRLRRALSRSTASAGVGLGGSAADARLDAWVAFAGDVAAAVAAADEVLTWLEDMAEMDSLQDALEHLELGGGGAGSDDDDGSSRGGSLSARLPNLVDLL